MFLKTLSSILALFLICSSLSPNMVLDSNLWGSKAGSIWKEQIKPPLLNSYSPKWRWIVEDIYRAMKWQGKYPDHCSPTLRWIIVYGNSNVYSTCNNINQTSEIATIVIISLGTPHLFADNLSSPPPPHPQCKVEFYPSNLVTIFQNWIRTSNNIATGWYFVSQGLLTIIVAPKL